MLVQVLLLRHYSPVTNLKTNLNYYGSLNVVYFWNDVCHMLWSGILERDKKSCPRNFV